MERHAQILHAHQIAQRTEESAPAVGPAFARPLFRRAGMFRGSGFALAHFAAPHGGLDAPAGDHFPPLGRESLLRVEGQTLGGEYLELIDVLDWKLDELGHAHVRVLLELPHDDSLVVQIGDGLFILGNHLVLELRHRPIPRVHAQQAVEIEIIIQRRAVPTLGLPTLDGFVPQERAPADPGFGDGFELKGVEETLA